ncbi:rRNA adenine N-6-methyltransferase family protein [Candidatus Vidania fulgoroideorum]
MKDKIFFISKKNSKKIIKKCNFKKKDIIIEIGSGIGNISKYIYKKAKRTFCIEINNNFFKFLKKKYKVINIDFLKIKIIKKSIIFGSIPYNLIKKIISKIIVNLNIIKIIYLIILDKYLKIIKKKYSIFFYIKKLYILKNNLFFPKPKVNSILIKLVPKIFS